MVLSCGTGKDFQEHSSHAGGQTLRQYHGSPPDPNQFIIKKKNS